MSYEANFDGLVGPTHNYSGLSFGNIASTSHRSSVSNPREAALQGLQKMRYIAGFGKIQGVLPPQERPDLSMLRSLGFFGSDEEMVRMVFKKAPELLSSCYSSSSMWAANAATVTPSIDAGDGHVHITPANLCHEFHRSLEAKMTAQVLQLIFNKRMYFKHHEPLPSGATFSDEGAANHTRFCREHGRSGVHLFVFGREVFNRDSIAPLVYPARQTLEASQTIARRHEIFSDRVLFAQQHPLAIDSGVFHNDVISIGNRNLFLYHEDSFVNTPKVIETLRSKVEKICETDLITLPVSDKMVTIKEAVATYLFNSQIIDIEDNLMAIIAPVECEKNPRVAAFLDKVTKDNSNPIKEVHYVNLKESMNNGGGPACLRIRMVLNQNEVDAINPSFLLTDSLYDQLTQWINKHYRDRLSPEDLADPLLIRESFQALDELTQILGLGAIYSFQGSNRKGTL